MAIFLKRLGLALLSISAIIGLAAITALVIAPETRRALVASVMGPYPDGRDASWHTPGGEELVRSNNQHYYLALNIGQCFDKVNFAWETGPASRIGVPLVLGLQPSGENAWQSDNSGDLLKLTNYQRSLIALSTNVSLARTQFASSVADSNFMRYLLQISIIAVGALTTITVSLKSILANNSPYSTLVGVLAIILAAVGTALSGVNSFVGPGETYARAERALLQARQLHLELGLLAAQEGKSICADFDPDGNDPRTKRIKEISDRLKETIGLSGTTISSSAQTSPPSGQASPSK